ncbi:hypothetical protein IWQ60_003005 [Tieghemiomyces parasiticus]|uniref:3-oxo-5-alpha-steroid 4-dehydrogenase C-terminal domain-containing protein n=1 Tax=Tieghemiomyces parasiticus TaxID=78921 RepID=A0A9W8DV64_9FUNG|nr:hypothetical protein IWQ60_003005 [Tieghemiomyces parasiticus]
MTSTVAAVVAGLHLLGHLVRTYYATILVTAVLMLFSPLSRSLLLHGKTCHEPAHSGPSSSGPTGWVRGFKEWTVPNAFFRHFYAVGSLWNAALLSLILLWFTRVPLQGTSTGQSDTGSSVPGTLDVGWAVLAAFLPAGPWAAVYRYNLDFSTGGQLPASTWSHVYLNDTLRWLGAQAGNHEDRIAHLATATHVQLTIPASAVFVLILFQIHLMRRLFECYFVQRPSASRMHMGHYLLGISFYLVTCPALILDTIQATIVSAERRAPVLREPAAWYIDTATTSLPYTTGFGSWTVLLGAALFTYAAYHQFCCHRILARLRAGTCMSRTAADSPPVYRVPKGDWFDWIECPHYYAEILIYLSLTLILVLWIPSTTVGPLTARASTWQITAPLPGLNLFLLNLWNIVNLSISAYSTHRWYTRKFSSEYPANRWLIMPGIY